MGFAGRPGDCSWPTPQQSSFESELQYESQEAFIVDSAKIATKLAVHGTPLDQALADTLATYRTNPAS